MAAPVSVITDSTFVSNLDLHKPQILNTMFSAYGDQGFAYLMMRSLGFEKPVAGDTYGHFEEDLYHSTCKQESSTSVGDPGAGNDITLTLDASKLDSDNNYYIRVGDVITFPNETQGHVRTITVTAGGLGGGVDQVVVVVRPNKATKTTGAVAGGTELIITSGMFTEGDDMPNPVTSGVYYYDNDAQIIKESIGVTGTELANETWIESYNAAGEFQGYYRKGQKEIDYRMMLKIDGMFWLGERVDTTAGRAVKTSTGYAHKGSEGIIPFIRRKGNVNPYTVGAYSVDEFDSYALTFEKNFVSTNVPIWMPMGTSLNIEVENELKDYFDNTNISYAKQTVNSTLFKGDEALGATVNFKYFTKANRTYLFTNLPGFGNPTTYGVTGYDFQKMGFAIPLETRREPTTGNDISSIGMRYRAMGRLNRRMITDTLSGIGATMTGRPVHTVDKSNTYAMAHMGTEFFGGNRFILIDPS